MALRIAHHKSGNKALISNLEGGEGGGTYSVGEGGTKDLQYSYRAGNTLELCPCRFLKVKNVNG